MTAKKHQTIYGSWQKEARFREETKPTMSEEKESFKSDLEVMFQKQEQLQAKLKNNVRSQEFISSMTLACIDELMEALRETPWKPWKKQQAFNEEKFKEELIDAWHFIINLSLASGMTSNELYQRFMEKNKTNFKRQNEGY